MWNQWEAVKLKLTKGGLTTPCLCSTTIQAGDTGPSMLYKAGPSWAKVPGWPGPVRHLKLLSGRCRGHFYARQPTGLLKCTAHTETSLFMKQTLGRDGTPPGRHTPESPRARSEGECSSHGQERGYHCEQVDQEAAQRLEGRSTACSSSREDERSKQASSVSKRWAWIPGSWLSHSCLKLGVPPS